MRHENRPREPTPPQTHPAEVPPVQTMDEDRLREAVQLVLMRMAFSQDKDNLLSALGVANTQKEPHEQRKATDTTGRTGPPYANAPIYEPLGRKRESQRYEHLNKDTMESPNEVC